MTTTTVQNPPDDKAMVDLVSLDLRIGSAKKVVVWAPRRSGLTTAMQHYIELFHARKPWIHKKYIDVFTDAGELFTMNNPQLFKQSDENSPVALFIDQGLQLPMRELRHAMSSVVPPSRLAYCFIFWTGHDPESWEKLAELRDGGFEVIDAPLVRVARTSVQDTMTKEAVLYAVHDDSVDESVARLEKLKKF